MKVSSLILSAMFIGCFGLSWVSGQERMKVEVPFSKLDAKTLATVTSINSRLSTFSDGCTKEADEAADKLNRSLWTSAACGASLATAETGVGLVAAAIACTAVKFATDDRVLAEKGLQECKAMQTIYDKYKQHCSSAQLVTFFEKDKVHCVDGSGHLIYVVDFQKKSVNIFKR